MKLKTKIMFICGINILLFFLLCGIAFFLIVKNSLMDAATSQSLQNATQWFSDIRQKTEAMEAGRITLDDSVMEYILKQKQNDYLVCYTKDGQNVFNNTIFSKTDFDHLQFRNISELQMEQAEMKWENQHFIVTQDLRYGEYNIYYIEDITYVWNRLTLTGISLAILTIILIAGSYIVLSIMLNRLLHPLQELNTSAQQIAQGRYDQRIQVERKDEIGQLSNSFNQMAEAVEHRTQSLEESERRKTLFMGDLTHELKTPLTAISGYAKTLLTVKLPEEDKEDALSYIYEESCRLERLSKKMMNLLLLEEEEHITLTEVPVGKLFHNAGEACAKNLDEKKITLEYHENGELFLVDEDLFTDVLINLIDNAAKASKEGDRIILSAADHTIEVQDFGTGIPKEEQEKILEPFYMIDKSRSRKSGGAGLGLAITAMILKRHNCRLTIESNVGEGTRMILQFV